MELMIHICKAEIVYWAIRRWKCPNCGKRRMLIEAFEWYPGLVSCLNCGDCWSEGERLQRPFYRNWRAESVEEMKRRLTQLALGRKECAAKNADTQRVILSVSQGEQTPALRQ